MSRSQSSHGPGGVLILLAALIFGLAFSSASEAALTYTIPTELKKASCSGDSDGDCLDNVEESNLAWAVAPWYFYDEGEDCSGWRNSYGLPAFHFARQDFFQVRPEGFALRDWSPSDKAKWVKVSYFFNYPHDCRSTVGFGGHQGDSEHVRVELYSYDLKTWYLYQAYYAHHGQDHYFSGTHLEERALALGTNWISVAADEDSHGSWPGLDPDSADCAGPEDDFCGSTCDCFVGTWRQALNTSGREVVGVSRNIGGPAPETWNPSVLTVAGGEAYTELDVGHGLNREYWTPRGDAFQKFCGWECPAASRNADGTCAVPVHDRTGCASPLSTKVDTSTFQLQAGSCAGNCNGTTSGCFCDSQCVRLGDCCPDACAACGVCGLDPSKPVEKASQPEFFAPTPAQAVDPEASSAAVAAVESMLPQLRGAKADQQLRTLRWMLASGDDQRLVFLFDDLRELRTEPLKQRATTARQRLEEVAADLEAAGYGLSESVEEAARINPDAPAPNTFPPSVLDSLGLNRDGSRKEAPSSSTNR